MPTKTLFDRAAKTITATGQMRYKNAYKRRLMDKCIMGDIINGDPENIKQFLGHGKGCKVELYIPGTVKIRDTGPDGGIIYQTMTDTFETFGMNYESYWAVKFRPEDEEFAPFDFKSPYLQNGDDQMARHIERKFGDDIINKVPSFNTGHNAGAMNRCFDIGGVTDGQAVVLYKTQKQCDDATGVQHRDVAADFMVKMANVLQDGEGLSGNHVSLIVNSPIKHLIQTSELKYQGFMGRNAALGMGPRGGRSEVKFLGTMDDTITVIQDNVMVKPFTYVSGGKTHTVYPILAMMKDACAYIDDVLFRDDGLTDVATWDKHHRAKQVYDWPVVFPQMLAVGYVEIAEPAYQAG